MIDQTVDIIGTAFLFAAEEEREERDRVPYSLWAEQGHLTMTPGNVIDYRFIRQHINGLFTGDMALQSCGYDPYNATQLAIQLAEEDGLNLVQFRQGFISMNAPSKDLEARLIAGRVRHGNNPVLRWMAGNVAIRVDPAGNIKADKSKSTGRIDGIVALIMGIGMLTMQRDEGPSVYETRGALEF